MGDILLFGVPVLAVLWSVIGIFKDALDKVPVVKFTLTQVLMALTLGLASLAAAYESQLAAWLPNLPEYVKAFGILVIPMLVFLGVWQPVTNRVMRFKNFVTTKLIK
jgi:hypothetical protein